MTAKYLIDSNSLIDADLKWYRPNVFKSVWSYIANSAEIEMSELVYQEIKYPVDLVNWTHAVYGKKRITVDVAIQTAYINVMQWIKDTESDRWSPAGYASWEFPDKADPWLIATAISNRCTIVTLDGAGKTNRPDLHSHSGREPKISAVAAHFNVPTVTIYELLEQIHLNL